MKNEDDACFKWAVTTALHLVERDGKRITKLLKMQNEKLNLNGIEFPVRLRGIEKVEKSNNLFANVFGYEMNVYPLGISYKQCETVVDLLLISDDEKQHYCVVKSPSRLSSQVSNT